jgi:hypothetical protein
MLDLWADERSYECAVARSHNCSYALFDVWAHERTHALQDMWTNEGTDGCICGFDEGTFHRTIEGTVDRTNEGTL